MNKYQNLQKYLYLLSELSMVKRAKVDILQLANEEMKNALKQDKMHVFKMMLKNYNYSHYEKEIYLLENKIHKIIFNKEELSELEKHVDVKQNKNDFCEITLDEVNFLHTKLIYFVNS